MYAREIGKGTSVIVLLGGPDFDHSHLLPELDRLSDAFHLIDYDQRGRGCSAVFGSSSYVASSLSGIQKLDRRYSRSGVDQFQWGLEPMRNHAENCFEL